MAAINVNDIDAIIKVLESVTQQNKPDKDEKMLKRCWFQLGLCYDLKKQFNQSVNCFQNLIRLDGQNVKAWQCLGEAYFKRGSYVNSMKAFIKAIQLRDPSDPVAKSQHYEELKVAKIKSLINCLPEALTIYNDILASNPDSVLTLIELTNVKLLMATEKFNNNLSEEGFNLCDEVFLNTFKASKLRPDLVMPYNLSSNCCLLCLKHFKNFSTIKLMNTNLNQLQLCQIGVKFTQKAISLNNWPYLWSNLVIFYLLIYSQTKDLNWFKKAVYSLIRSKVK